MLLNSKLKIQHWSTVLKISYLNLLSEPACSRLFCYFDENDTHVSLSAYIVCAITELHYLLYK